MVTENQIIKGCISGNHDSLGMLYQRYASVMLGICCRYCKTRTEAEDVLQEGFIKVFQKISTYKGKGSFEGWLRRIMINTAINHFKANSKHYYHEDIDLVNNISIKSDEETLTMEKEISQDELIQLIQELPAGYNMIFNLYVIDGLTHAEISNDLGISINTSKTQLMKARKWLRNKLSNKEKLYSQH